MRSLVRRILPSFLIAWYHLALAYIGAWYYRHPSRKIIVIGVTGTKGKTSVAEILMHIFEAAGYRTAVLGTLRFKIGEKSERNLKKMTMPGRFFVQKFLRDAVSAGCTHAIIEMTSEGAKQYRQRGIEMDALIFTNLAPEHIESHGSYEAYRDAKLSIARTLARSTKSKKLMVANIDDKEGGKFLGIPGVTPLPYGAKDGEPLEADKDGVTLTWKEVRVHSHLPGRFNAMNILAAATAASGFGVLPNVIAAGVARADKVEGRMERIDMGQTFPVFVDYAHTPDSLEAVYSTFPNNKKICVLGNTGGGRDKWKRPVMGEIAERHCDTIILTNEDPYDEDPMQILEEIKTGMHKKTPTVILDRREAIARAIRIAHDTPESVVLITGKGTDPFIMGPNGTKVPWDDRDVTREELHKL
jgi:UDP-N-acetylmuramoyl-L-alanyl-D-glutamate--2,6-diaminopimelate ligase